MVKKVTKIEANQSNSFNKLKLRVAAYCRVSTDSDEQLESLQAQRKHYESYINKNPDWEYAGIYYDEGISGTKKENRAQLVRMIRDCENNKIDLIITKSISRFSRNTTDCLEMVRKLLEIGTFIYFEKENINTQRMENELMLSILSSLAENESISTSKNNKWAIQKRFQNGTYKISYPPYGYENKDGQMVVNEEQAETVRIIFAEALSGKGTQKIADNLNSQGIPSKRGGRWQATTILGILKNEKYTGDVILQKTYTDSSFNKRMNYGEKDKYFIENHHEAIISHDEFEAVQAIIDQRAREKGIEKGNNKYQNRYSFTSKIICSECGSNFKRRVHSSGRKKYVAWCCNKHLREKDECSMKFIRDEDIKNTFVNMLNKLIFGRSLILKPLRNVLSSINKSDILLKIEEIEKQTEEKMQQRELLISFMKKGYLEQTLFKREKNDLQMDIDNYIQQKETLLHLINGESSKAQEIEDLIKFTNKADMIDTFDEKIFNEYVEQIMVFSREEIGFILKCGLTLRERM